MTIHTTPHAQRTLQDRIDSLQRRADAMRGKPGYLAILARLRDARTAALAVKRG